MNGMKTSGFTLKKRLREGRRAAVRLSLVPSTLPSFVSIFLSHLSWISTMCQIPRVPHTPPFSSSSCVSSGAFFRSTRPLCFSFINNKHFSPREAVDVHHEVAMRNENVFSSGLEDSIDWNLLRDPTGGLEEEENSAEELSEQELLQEMTSRQLQYKPEVFYLLFTPLIDIVSLLVDHQLLPETSKKKKNCLLKKAKQRAKEIKKKEEEEEKQKNRALLEQEKLKNKRNTSPPSTDSPKDETDEKNPANALSPQMMTQDCPPPSPPPSTSSSLTHDTNGCTTSKKEEEMNDSHSPTDTTSISHDRSIHHYPSSPPDVVSLSKHARHISDRSSIAVSNWFLDGKSALARPRWTEEKMGPERYRIFTKALTQEYEKLEAAMPLSRFFRRHPSLPASLFIPFLRQLSLEMYSTERRAAAVKVVPGIIVTLANGRVVPQSFHLPGVDPHTRVPARSPPGVSPSDGSASLREKNVDEQRVQLITEMFMAAAQETGTTDLAYLALQLLRANGLTVPFTLQKQLTNVFSTASRITTDWRVRSSGVLAECLPKWKVYLKQVKGEVCNAWLKEEKETLLLQESQRPSSEHEKDKEEAIESACTEECGSTPSFTKGENRNTNLSFTSKEGETEGVMDATTSTQTEAEKKERGRKTHTKGVSQGGEEENDTDVLSAYQDEKNEEVKDYFSRERQESTFDASSRTGRDAAAEVSHTLHQHIKTAMDRRVREWVRQEAAAQMKNSAKTVGKKKKAEGGGSGGKVGRKRTNFITKEVLESVLRREYVDGTYNNKVGEFAEDEEEEEEEAESEKEEEEEEVEEEEEEVEEKEEKEEKKKINKNKRGE